MVRIIARAGLVAIVLGVALWAARGLVPVVAQPPSASAEGYEAIVLLKNGQTLEGRIVPAGDRLLVAVAGGEISVKRSDVELVCQTVDEAYQQKRARIQHDSVRDHLDLAQWCQQRGLLGAAARELADAMAIDPTHPMIPMVERRLNLALQQPERSVAKVDPASRPPTSEELDRLVRGMPPGTVETFTQTIQPMLLNNCTASGCHGPGSEQGLSLLRVPVGRTPSRRLTQRNLFAVLQWIHRADPAASPLLGAPIRPHGTAKAPIFTDRQVGQYQELVDWVYKVAQVPSPFNVASRREHARRPSRVVPANHEEPLAAEGATASSGASGRFPRPTTSAPQHGEPIPSSVPADPLDPEVFNRRFAPAPSPTP